MASEYFQSPDTLSDKSLLRSQLLEKVFRNYLSQAVVVATKKGIAEVVTNQAAISIYEIAKTLNCHETNLYRLLSFLAANGIFEERDGQQFIGNDLSEAMREDVPQNAYRIILATGSNSQWQATFNMEWALDKSCEQTPFERANGEAFYTFLSHHHEEQRNFDLAIVNQTQTWQSNVPLHYDFSRFENIVDLAGGCGALLKAILLSCPTVNCTLFEAPSVVENVLPELSTDDSFKSRFRIACGDFTQSVGVTADLFIVAMTLHCFDDTRVLKILSNIVDAMHKTPHCRLLIIEADYENVIIPNNPFGARQLDMAMMLMMGGRERAFTTWQSLLQRHNLKVLQKVPFPPSFCGIEYLIILIKRMELDEYISLRNLGDIHCIFNGRSIGICSCHITSHHLMIVGEEKSTPRELTFLHKQIDSIEQIKTIIVENPETGQTTTLTGPTVVLKMKDFAILAVVFQGDTSPVTISSFVSTLSNLSNIDTTCFFYPFYYSPESPTLSADGWESFSLETEFRSIFNSQSFRLSSVNREYTVCESYPQLVVVPKNIDDDMLVKSAAFRRLYRFPVVSYCHKNGASLVRSAEPLIGQNGVFRCREDEQLLNAYLKGDSRGVIIDTRHQSLIKPKQNRGGGTEPLANYPRWQHQNQPIDRPESMKKSYERLIELLIQRRDLPVDGFLDKLSNTAWLHVVRDALNCACVAAQLLDRDAKSVLVHGSDGLDTTLVVTSLSQVVLNSDSRTIRGFVALVDREWVNAGHPFRARCFKGPFAVVQNRESAPTFLVFLDCVWQITQQFPCSFEFNDKLLITLFRHAYFSEYGTFMCNSEREQSVEKVRTRTISLWSYLLRPDVLETMLNPLYEPNRGEAIWPSVQPVALDLWRSLYLANIDARLIANDSERLRRFNEVMGEHKELLALATRLKRQLAMLQVEAQQAQQQPQQIGSKSSDSGISTNADS